MHVAPLPQTFPHAPQLALSLVRFTHAPFGHCVGVAESHIVLHLPPEQTHAVAPAGTGMAAQLLPQAPQLAKSDCKLTHCPLHSVWPIGHAHVPAEHCCPPVHAVPQAPQFIGSVCKSTHAFLQFVSGGPESVAHVCTHVPSKQLGVAAGHLAPHRPQFAGSVFVFTQAFAQAARGEQLTPLSVNASTTGGPSLRASVGGGAPSRP
jgi:hypothetical protein